jgi:hypothetical protein
MQLLNEKSHYSTIISSLNKQYKQSKIGKSITPNDIYLLNIIYKLLIDDIVELTDNEKKQLLTLYRTILYNSKYICYSNYICNTYIKTKDKTIQANKEDCNNIPNVSINNIYYWQEEDLNTTIEDIIPLTYTEGYFTNKLFDTYSNFENIGKTITYTNIGRIAFYATESNNQSFIITDILNNDVTDIFDIIYLSDSNSTLFVSKNFYSYGNIFFRFKQTTELNIIFDVQFNNIFQ